MPREERRTSGRTTRRRERVIRLDSGGSQLLEEGAGPSGPVGSLAGSPAEFTGEGGEGTSTPGRYGGPMRRRDDPPNHRNQPSGGEGGVSTLGAGSGARGREGLQVEGESSWDASEARRERGVRRTDESLHEEIWEQLAHHPDIDASGIEVQVEAGEVTLQGTVEDRDMRWLVADLVEAVSGVSLVHNQLRVARR